MLKEPLLMTLGVMIIIHLQHTGHSSSVKQDDIIHITRTTLILKTLLSALLT